MRLAPRSLLFLVLLLLVASACTLGREAAEEDLSPTSTLESAPLEATSAGLTLPDIDLPEVKLPEVEVPADALETAQAAAQQAGDTAGTAVQQAGEAASTAAQQAEEAAGTAAAVATLQGGAALATVQAVPTPDLTELTERLAAARPDENGNLSVTLNEAELNQLLQLRYLVLSAEPELRDAAVRFSAGEIELHGTVPLPLPVGVKLTLRPEVADGQFDLAIIDAALGPIQAPEAVLRFAGNILSDALHEIIRRLPEGFQLQSIEVDEGSLIISGKING
jgi:hypothetical protein